MFLLNLILFVGLLIASIYGVELVLPPFGKLYYTDIVDIVMSASKEVTLRLNLSGQMAVIALLVGLSIIPFIVVIFVNLKIKKKKKSGARYTFK